MTKSPRYPPILQKRSRVHRDRRQGAAGRGRGAGHRTKSAKADFAEAAIIAFAESILDRGVCHNQNEFNDGCAGGCAWDFLRHWLKRLPETAGANRSYSRSKSRALYLW
jgi:hypothetical protein